MARRPADGVQVIVRRETLERLQRAAEERLVGYHLLADRLISAGLDALPPVDSFGRPAEPPPVPYT